MQPTRHQREVENRLRDALRIDRARVQVGRISRFGLMEMSRQRLRPSLGESSQIVCPRCMGQGTVRGVESLALSILRILEEEAMKEKTGRVIAHVPVDVGTYLLNEKREILITLEQRHQLGVTLIPTPSLETPHYEIKRVRIEELGGEHGVTSHEMIPAESETGTDLVAGLGGSKAPEVEKPAVQAVSPQAPAPIVVRQQPAAPAPSTGLIRRMWISLFGKGAEPEEEKKPPAPAKQRSRASGDSGRGGRGGRPGGGRRRGQPARRSEGGKQQRGKQTGRANGGAAADGKAAKEQPPAQARAAAKEAGEPRESKESKVDVQASDKQQQAAAGKGGQGQARSGSRRGRRGGRRRSGPRRDGAAAQTPADAASAGPKDSPKPQAGGGQAETAKQADVKPQQADAPKTGKKPSTPEPAADSRAGGGKQADVKRLQAVSPKADKKPSTAGPAAESQAGSAKQAVAKPRQAPAPEPGPEPAPTAKPKTAAAKESKSEQKPDTSAAVVGDE
jgi:ribonuclease E